MSKWKLKRLEFLKAYGLSELYSVIRREIRYLKKRKTGRYARFSIDKKLEFLLPHFNGFYVELGANDGALASNSYYFELKKNWRGVLIEPAPNLYLSCLKRRGRNNHVYCNACVPFNYGADYVSMRYLDSMSFSEALDLDIADKEEFIKAGKKWLQPGEVDFQFWCEGRYFDRYSLCCECSQFD